MMGDFFNRPVSTLLGTLIIVVFAGLAAWLTIRQYAGFMAARFDPVSVEIQTSQSEQ